MEAKSVVLQNKGMRQDESISKSTNEYAYENYGIRITGEQDNTALSVTNEKGPKKIHSLEGVYLGHCCVGSYIVVFTCSSDNKTSYIYRVVPGSQVKTLFSGDLGFNTDCPIESIGWYESEDIIKVYWIDDWHSPRFINISDSANIKKNDIYQFDFTPQIGNTPYATITKDYTKSGMFSQGTIQYFISYYNKFGAETGIVWQSSVQYISFKDRGAKADENVNCGFNIALSGLNKDFEYVRIYSAQRSSQDGPISARLVADIKIDDTARIGYTDLGTSGEAIDSTMLYYIGGQSFKAGTLAQKDGVLFFGNIDISGTEVAPEIKTLLESRIEKEQVYIDDYSYIQGCKDICFETKSIEASPQEGYYSHKQQINHSQYNIATFKYGEVYRFAIQFMIRTGEWTSAIWIGDKVCDRHPELSEDGKYYIVPTALWTQPDGLYDLIKNDYTAYRILLADTSVATRKILAQGVVSPTLFNYYERYYNKPHSIASWNFRPRNSEISSAHLEGINTQYRRTAELQGLRQSILPLFSIDQSEIEAYKYYNLIFGVDAGTEMVCKLILFNLPEQQTEAEQEETYKKIMSGEQPLPAYNSGEATTKSGSYREILSVRQDKSTWNKVISAIFSDLTDKCAEYGKEAGATISTPPILESQMPSRNDIKDILSWQYGTKAWAIALSALVAVGAALVAITSWGTAAGAAAAVATGAISSILGGLTAITVEALSLSIAILGSAATCQSVIDTADATKIEKSLARKGWVYYGRKKEAQSAIQHIFKGISNFPSFQGTDNGSFWLTGGRLTFKKASEIYADSSKEQFYVDDSLVTFHSPELEDNQDVLDNNQAIDMKIVGYVPIQSVYSNYLIEKKTVGYESLADIIRSDTSFNQPMLSADTEGLLSGYLYQDSYLKTALEDDKVYRQGEVVPYKTFLWNRETSLSLGGGHTAKLMESTNVDLDYAPSQLQHKVFANIRYSTNTQYFKKSNPWYADYGIWPTRIFNSDELTTLNIERDELDFDYYYGNYDGIATFKDKYEILTSQNYTETETNSEDAPDVSIPYGKGISSYNPSTNKWEYSEEGSSDSLMIADPVRIKFKSTPHAVISFKSSDDFQPILPIFKAESYNLRDVYPKQYNVDKWYSEIDGDVMPSESVLNDYYSLLSASTQSVLTMNLSKFDRGAWIKQETIGGPDTEFYINGTIAEQTEIGTTALAQLKGRIDVGNITDVYKNLLQYKNPIFKVAYKKDSTSSILDVVWVCLNAVSGTDANPIIKMKIISDPNNIVMDLIIADTDTSYSRGVPGVYYQFRSRYKIVNSKIYEYHGHPVYNAKTINEDKPAYPYLYIAELYKKNFDYGAAYDDPERLSWNICSSVTDVLRERVYTYGDTYYQRWDCLKTYPFTEEDTNSIVDILSFMVETHKNLDGRCDINRGTSNILNARPTNWDLVNNAYTQNDDMIRYNVLDEKFDLSRFRNQVVWSLPKVDSADVDTWTNITLNNSLSLDGTYGEITKLISNANGALVAFQPKAISTINYNNSTALSTESGVPIEIANSGKVTGYDIVHNSTGCFDKWTVCSGGSGIYFVDHYNKSMYLLNGTALTNLSTTKGMSKFFRKITDNFETWQPSIVPLPVRLSYDGITNDVYINSGEYSLLYNEKMGAFTSFMPYQDMVMLSDAGKSLAIDINGNIYEMFEGEYNVDKDGNQIDYYMDYRVNPEPYIDKVFTNIEYVADTFSSSSSVDGQAILDRSNPFDKLEVWNEYQSGECELKEQTMPTNLRQKFRIWRAQIPRDKNSKYKLDRIRNPWCHIKLSKKTSDSKKIEFHQMTTTYFK